MSGQPESPTATVEIEKLVYGGDGLSRLPADAKGRRLAVFTPMVLPGEKVEIAIGSAKGGMTRAEAVSVLQPSPDRVAPGCPYFGVCGGCQLQHGSYELQIAAKREILQETFARARLDISAPVGVLAGEPWQYRNRIRLHVRHAPQWQAGYLERRSHRMLPVAECPIAAPLLQVMIAALARPEVAALAPRETREVELFCNEDESQITILAIVDPPTDGFAGRFEAWCNAIAKIVPQLQGGSATARGKGDSTRALAHFGEPRLEYSVGDQKYRVSAGSFFQINRFLLPALVERVIEAARELDGKSVIDLYAGVGLFSRALAAQGASVVAVESAESSSDDLAQNLSGHQNATAVRATAEHFLTRAAAESRPGRTDVVLVDPPRAGLGADVTRQLSRLAAPTLLYLSCDPMTLARDLAPLLAAGYVAEHVTMIDLFPQTFHLETLVTLQHNRRA